MVKGGLLWFHHVLIAAVDVANSYQVCYLVTFTHTNTNTTVLKQP